LVCENEMGEVPLACLIDKERQEREKALRQRQERCDDLSRLFSCMTPHQRQVVCWKHIEGLSCRQIASRLGLREQSVRATLHYTLQALKKKSSGEKDPLS
ncbi:MAG: sigma-70 family RNA polymerase sigma factor, partial [Armatimonadetes bacterium]|nr:sigma-70 family RNA polymerase sigma factor [Armatimonadota bacterium]